MKKIIAILLTSFVLGATLYSNQIVINKAATLLTTIINNTFNNITNTTGTFLEEGGQVAWISGLQFNTSAAEYHIQNSAYTSTEQSITLDAADPTLPRIDVIGLDDTGTIFKTTGTAQSNPSEPTIDPGTQLKLVIVSIAAGATDPGVTTTTVYYDNAGSPTEWDWTTSGSGFNVNSTSNPKSPSTKDIEGTNVTSGAYAQGALGSGNFDINSADMLVMYIRSKATWTNKRGLQVVLYSSGVLAGATVVINRSGTWGFDSSITGSYQQVAIPVSNFRVPLGNTINQIRIIAFGSGSGFYIDDIYFQGGAIINAENITIPQLAIYKAAICQNATATLGFSTPTSNPAVAACVTGTNTQFGVAQFADTSNLSIQDHFYLPAVDSDNKGAWTGVIDLRGKWRTSATTGSVVWQVATICVADGETSDPSFNTASTVTEAAKGTTLWQNDFEILAITTTGCAVGEEMYFKFFRDATHGSDNLAATADLISLTFIIRRAF